MSSKERAEYQMDCIEQAIEIADHLFGDCECCGDRLHEDMTLHYLMVQIKSELKRRGYIARPIDRDLLNALAGGAA